MKAREQKRGTTPAQRSTQMTDNASAEGYANDSHVREEGCADDSQCNSRELCRRQAMQSVKAAQKKGNVSADGYADDKSTLAEGYADDR